MKRYVGDQITLTGAFTNANGAATDPTSVTFVYRVGRDGTDTTLEPTNPAVGSYQVQVTPDRPGNLYGYFLGSGSLVKSVPVSALIHPRQVKQAF